MDSPVTPENDAAPLDETKFRLTFPLSANGRMGDT